MTCMCIIGWQRVKDGISRLKVASYVIIYVLQLTSVFTSYAVHITYVPMLLVSARIYRHCRIVAGGDIMQYVVEDSGQVFLFDQEYGLTQEEVSTIDS